VEPNAVAGPEHRARAMSQLLSFARDVEQQERQLARRAGLVNGSHVGRIECGAGMAAPKTVARLAAALGVEEAALSGG
jgi:transcriptional regulator with XRE-family HTH domain